MKILITAGGTSERIDDVRRITNSGTGRLGAKIAESFAAGVQGSAITYICSENAARPSAEICRGGALDVRVTEGVDSVEAAVRKACAQTAFDVIVHSMAISDYQVRAVSDSSLMTQNVLGSLPLLTRGDQPSAEAIVREALLSAPGIRENKISSDKDDLIVVLKRAPKIIALLRGLAPDAVITGFKLLSGAGEEELARVGHALLVKNDCDLVFANDAGKVQGDRHEGILIARDGSYERASGKDGIAALIAERVKGLLIEKGRLY